MPSPPRLVKNAVEEPGMDADDSNPDHKNDPLGPRGLAPPVSSLALGSTFTKVASYLPTSNWFTSFAALPPGSNLNDDNEPVTPAEVGGGGRRDELIEAQLAQRESEYINLKDINVFIGTWNVNGRAPNESLDAWLNADLDDRSSGLPEGSGFFSEKELNTHKSPDMFVIGFQELDLSKEAFVFTASPREQEWRHAVDEALRARTKRLGTDKSAEYQLERSIRLVGMMLLVYVTAEHKPFIRRVAAAQVGTGIMGKMGNKGAVAVRLEFHNTSICFVNAHLAAGGVAQIVRRNEDFKSIKQRLVFLGQDGYEQSIFDHDLIIWLGDLNYRIKQLTRMEVEAMIQANSLSKLTVYDELLDEIKAGRAFHKFQEGPVEFMPTYKYDVGTTRFDTSGKVRTPAWCDRVLWLGGTNVRALMYASIPSLLSSDHKPVVARLRCAIKVINSTLYKRTYENVLKYFDKRENDYLPIVSVDRQEFDFGDLAFLDEVEQVLTIQNTGQTVVKFDFIKPPNSASYCKPWLTLQPHTGELAPGEVCEVHLTIHIDKRAAPELNAGREKLDDVLILRLRLGRDFFIIIKGRYMPTSFGQPLDVLVDRYWHIPVREAQPMTNKKPSLAPATAAAAHDDLPPPLPPRRAKAAAVVEEAPLIDLTPDDKIVTKNQTTNNFHAKAAVESNLADNPTTDIPSELAKRILLTPFAQLLAEAHAEQAVPFELLWLLWDLYCRCIHGCKPVYTKTGSSAADDEDDRMSVLSEDDGAGSHITAITTTSLGNHHWTRFDEDEETCASSSLSSASGASSQTAQLFQLPGLEVETRAIRDALDTRKIVILSDAATVIESHQPTKVHAPLSRAVGSSERANSPVNLGAAKNLVVKVLYKLAQNDGAPPPPPWPLLPGSIHSVGEALLIFLEALPESLVPAALYKKALEAASHPSGSFGMIAEQILPRLPRVNRASLICLMALLRELTGTSSSSGSSSLSNGGGGTRAFNAPVAGGVNALRPSVVDKIFGHLVLRPSPAAAETKDMLQTGAGTAGGGSLTDGVRGRLARQHEDKKRAAFVKLFLVHPVTKW